MAPIAIDLSRFLLPRLPEFPLPPLPEITNPKLYKVAHTHASCYSNPKKYLDLDPKDWSSGEDYEKLEHVGDGLLGKWSER